MVKDSFQKKALSDPLKAGPVFEYLNSGSTGSEILLSGQGSRTLFQDNNDDEGSMIGPRSILRMRVETEEVPFPFVTSDSSRRHRGSKPLISGLVG